MWDTENQKTFINEKPLGKPSSKPFKGTNIASMVFNTKGKQQPWQTWLAFFLAYPS